MNDQTPKDQDTIEINGELLIPRALLAEKLPDIERFKQCLKAAEKLHADVTANDGQLPEYTEAWSESYLVDVLATVGEIGRLYSDALADMQVENIRRFSS